MALAASVALLALLLLALQWSPLTTRLANVVLGRIAALPRSTMAVKEARLYGVTHLEVRGLRAARGDTLLLAADTARVHWNLGELFAGRVSLDEVEVCGLRVSPGVAVKTPRKEAGPPLH
ncbi:MAG TPA: hypothetical protein VMJ30_01355, partial [Gemmatimonadales bacterium]|nr:hypothetical protein [Gemmatimonadales bacterium]